MYMMGPYSLTANSFLSLSGSRVFVCVCVSRYMPQVRLNNQTTCVHDDSNDSQSSVGAWLIDTTVAVFST